MGKLLLRRGLLQALHGVLKRLIEPPVLIFLHLHGDSSLFMVYRAFIRLSHLDFVSISLGVEYIFIQTVEGFFYAAQRQR